MRRHLFGAPPSGHRTRASWLALALALAALAGCGDDLAPPQAADAGPDGPSGPGKLAPCLAEPTQLAAPPVGQLPCELLPPGFVAP